MWEKKVRGGKNANVRHWKHTQNQKHFFPYARGQEYLGKCASCFAYALMEHEKCYCEGPWQKHRGMPKNRHFTQRRVIYSNYIILSMTEQHRLWHRSRKNRVAHTITNSLYLEREELQSAMMKPFLPRSLQIFQGAVTQWPRCWFGKVRRKDEVCVTSLYPLLEVGEWSRKYCGVPTTGFKPHFRFIRFRAWSKLFNFSEPSVSSSS